jgi:hypothetical protein
MFIRGSKIMTRIKEIIAQQLLDDDLCFYVMEKEHWNAQHFDSVD